MVLFDKYRVDRVLGQGGMAVVVAAVHLHLGEAVALKVLLPEVANQPTVMQRFLREAQAAARLKGEHVARVLDVATLPTGLPCIVMEYLEGSDLGGYLAHYNVLPPGLAVDLVLQACEALAEAHAAGIIHRDIKPANLFVTRRPDGSPLLKVLDFGISKLGDDRGMSSLTQHAILGTPSYMSPEQLRGSHDVDARTDIWSLGIVLYRMLGGHQPFMAESLSALAIQAATEPTPLLSVPLPPGLDAVVYRCLAKELDHRYATVAELALALAPFAGDPRAAAIVVERTQAITRWTPAPMVAYPGSPGAPTTPTTLRSSAGSIDAAIAPHRSRLPWVIGAGVLVGVAAAALFMLTAGGPVAPSAGGATTDTVEAAAPVAPSPPPPGEAPAVNVAAPAPVRPVDAGLATDVNDKTEVKAIRGEPSLADTAPAPTSAPAPAVTTTPAQRSTVPPPKPASPIARPRPRAKRMVAPDPQRPVRQPVPANPLDSRI